MSWERPTLLTVEGGSQARTRLVHEQTDQEHQLPGSGAVGSGLRTHEPDRGERNRAPGPSHRPCAPQLNGSVNRLALADWELTDFISQLLQLLWVAGDEDHAKTGFRELEGKLPPNPVGSPRND
jgi:hypothetical protein